MNIPLFIGSQEQEDDYPVCAVDAMRIVSEFTGAYTRVSLQPVEEIVNMRKRREQPDYVAADILLERGEELGHVENTKDLLVVAKDIEKLARRFPGNQLVVHPSEKKAFIDRFPDYAKEGFLLYTVEHPKLLGKIIMTYAANTNQVDSGLIMAYHIDSGQYGFSTTHVELYTRVIAWESNATAGGYSINQRRQRKASYN